jgi:hypothetical protein
MNRVEEFKILRKHKRKCIFILIFFLTIIITGILVSDFSINGIIKNENKVELLKFENGKDTTIKLNVLNKVFDLHYGGVVNDFDEIKSKVIGWGRSLLN